MPAAVYRETYPQTRMDSGFEPAGGEELYRDYISEDPIRIFSSDINFYVYTRNSPLTFSDPQGLDRYAPCEGHNCVIKWLCKKYVDWGCSGPKEEVCCKSEHMECRRKIDENDPQRKEKELICDEAYAMCKLKAGGAAR